ncbi:MAG: DUF2513 domain-containing protein [Planctomycetes bacterium]|nr:DUF2513 domain-containing protein [Planctomycetota bacterium]
MRQPALLSAIVEAHPSSIAPNDLEIDGYSEEQIGYHVYLMMEADLVKGVSTTHFGSTNVSATATGMTWDGYEFLDAAREDSRWDQAKKLAERVGGVTFKTMLDILSRLAKDAATSAMG